MGAQVLLATQNKSFRASKSHTGVIDTTVKHDFRHRLSQPLKHISMNPVNSNGREEDSPDSLALTQSKKGAEEGRLRDTGRTGVREAREGDGVVRERLTKNTQGAEQSFCVNGGDHGCQ